MTFSSALSDWNKFDSISYLEKISQTQNAKRQTNMNGMEYHLKKKNLQNFRLDYRHISIVYSVNLN